MRRAPPRRSRLWLAAAAALAVTLAVAALRSGAADAPAAAPAPQAQAAPQAAQAAPPPAPEPLASVPPAAGPAAAPVRADASPALAAEEDVMVRLRPMVDASPEAAVALADEGDRRFPSGPYADERAFLRMRALVHLDRIGIARDAARRFYERYPDSPLASSVFRLTGMRPLPPLGPPR